MASSFSSYASWWLAALTTALSVTAASTLHLLRLAVWPLAVLLGFVAAVLSPVTYTLRYAVLAPLFWVAGLVPRLEPLYIFLGSAAFVGLLAGIVLRFTSSSFASLLGMYEDEGEKERRRKTALLLTRQDGDVNGGEEEEQPLEERWSSEFNDSWQQDWPSSQESSLSDRYGSRSGSGSGSGGYGQGYGHYWSSDSRGLGLGIGKRRRVPGKLLSETIHEEEDSSE